MAAAGLAALASGCSDASRFAGDPFADPFAGSTKVASRGVDRAPTGAILPPAEKSAASTPVESRPLPAPSASAAAPRPVAQAPAPAGSLGPARWSAEGGTPIVVSQGETAAVLATRYGVPADALLRTNGFTTAAQIKPGARVVIPVYRA
ncbi:LysM domain-containing protein, partial [Methylocystis sp. 9N]